MIIQLRFLHLALMGFLGLSILVSCSEEADFGGGREKESLAKEDGEATGIEPGGAPEPGPTENPVTGPAPTIVPTSISADSCDMNNDFIALEFPEQIQTCVDSGNLYDFGNAACTDIPVATSFECDFDSYAASAKGLRMPEGKIQLVLDAKAQGAKLIGCGERRAGKTIVAQWLVSKIDQEKCEVTENLKIVTVCFQEDNGDGAVAEGKTDEEVVAACLSGK